MGSPDSGNQITTEFVYGVKNVYYSFGAHPALTNVTFSVKSGEIHALVGAHHSGKSALCAVMSGRLAPDYGLVVAKGAAYNALNPRKARDLGIAHLSARPRIYPRQTVLENIMMGDRSRWRGFFPSRRNRRRIKDWLWDNEIVLPLNERMQDTPFDMWVLVEILSKLYQNPNFLVMDEAIEELNQPWFGRIMALLRKHVDKGMGLLFITHKIEDALHIADRVSVMRRGDVILTSSARSMERLNLIRLCYAQLEHQDEYFSSQETFRELMRYTEAMLRDLPTAIVILDPKRTVRFLNHHGEEIFANLPLSGDELFGKDNNRLRDLVLAACAAETNAEYHGVPIASRRTKLTADVRVQPIRENDVVVGSMVIIEDVSLREDLRRRLVLSQQLASIGLLAAGVAHEVNNPLEIISNYLNYLREGTGNPETLEVISCMDDEIVRIHEITNNLIAYTGAGAKTSELVDIMALVKETVSLLQFHGSYQSVEFVCRENGGKAVVQANPAELRQVFLNLMRNATDAMPSGGKVIVSTEVRGEDELPGVVVKFADSGPGIDLENPNDVFLPFVSTKKSDGGHQGLGLYIVYGIIEKYGGSIEVTNLNAGGCEFRIALPMAR